MRNIFFSYSISNIIPLFDNFVNGQINDVNQPNIIWERLSDPLLVGVPQALRSVILNYKQTRQDPDEEKRDFFERKKRFSMKKIYISN